MGQNNANIPDLESLILAGIDPKTKLPLKATDARIGPVRIKTILRIIDETDCVKRYKWGGLPPEIDPTIIERILYYRGQLALFYLKDVNRFYVLPFAPAGEIDVYGRYTKITPLPFNGQSSSSTSGKDVTPWISGLERVPVYYADQKITGEPCVILTDYIRQQSQHVQPRQQLNEAIIDIESRMIPYLRTAMMIATGVRGMRVTGPDESANVDNLNLAIDAGALSGLPYQPVIGSLDFQDLTNGSRASAQEFLQAMQALDNWRRGSEGYDTNGVFEKTAHMLGAEQAMNAGGSSAMMNSGLEIRQQFCELARSAFADQGLDMSVSIDESVTVSEQIPLLEDNPKEKPDITIPEGGNEE